MTLGTQLLWLLLLSLPVACVAWTVTHEEVLKEFRDFCVSRVHSRGSLFQRKFFYLFTCEYCFSHYVAAFFIWLSGFALLLPGWRGYLIAWLGVVWIANQYMGLFNRLRLDIKSEKIELEEKEASIDPPSSQEVR